MCKLFRDKSLAKVGVNCTAHYDMNTRQINYIDTNENLLEIEAEQALLRGVEENFKVYFDVIIANYAIAGIDVLNYPAKREIYYIEDEP